MSSSSNGISKSNNNNNNVSNNPPQHPLTPHVWRHTEYPLPLQNMWCQLPRVLMLEVYKHLDPRSIGEASSTCRSWHTATDLPGFEEIKERSWALYDPRAEFSAVQVIDEKVWRRVFSPETLILHGLTFDDVDPLDGKALQTFLKKVDFSKIEGTGANTGVTILTIPKGLTFNKLVALAGSPREGGRVAQFRLIWDRITAVLGDTVVAKTYRVAIANNVLKESRGKTYAEQEQMALKAGGQMPEFLPAATLAILTYMSSVADPPIRLLGGNPYTYTHCIDTYTHCIERVDQYPLVVGNFAPTGLTVTSCFNYVSSDVGFSRKF